MARNTIFITGHKVEKKIQDGYWYSYQEEGENGILRVYKQDDLIFQTEAKLHDAFEMIVKGERIERVFITPMTPPRKDWEVVAWLLGFSKHERAPTYNEYLILLENYREKFEKPGYVESTLAGPSFEFAEYSLISGGDSKYHKLACWVDSGISKEEICHLIPEFIYPEFYVKKVLKERFGITDEEFEKALSVFD